MPPRSILPKAGRRLALAAELVAPGVIGLAAPAVARTVVVVGAPAVPYVWERPWRPRYGYPAPVVVVPPPAVVYQAAPPPPMAAPVPAAGGPVSGGPVTGSPVCREYQSQVVVGNALQPSYGTACLQPDGSWRIVD